jgi:hypothetical protein
MGNPSVPKFSRLQGSLISLIPTDIECTWPCTTMAGQLLPLCISANPEECWHMGKIYPVVIGQLLFWSAALNIFAISLYIHHNLALGCCHPSLYGQVPLSEPKSSLYPCILPVSKYSKHWLIKFCQVLGWPGMNCNTKTSKQILKTHNSKSLLTKNLCSSSSWKDFLSCLL